jgi:NAD(P)-dependent dehydrogenase (short-subunit alcohol dehydrogenase family)
MDLKLTKKIALVTGSTAGIGNAIAASLAREGATVIVSGRTRAAVDAAVAAMKAETKGDVSGFAGDLSEASVADAASASGGRHSGQ